MIDKPPYFPDLEFLRHQNRLLLERVSRESRPDGGGGGLYMPDMDERLGRVEGHLEGLKHSQNMLLGGIGILGTIISILVTVGVGLGVYELQRIDQIGDRIDSVNARVNELPGKISTELRDITKTLADVIIAAKQPSQAPNPPAPPHR
jgi:hypothetical protein